MGSVSDLALNLVRALTQRSATVTFAESCTGGLMAATLTEVAGASSVFRGSYVLYSDDEKTRVLGVGSDLIKQHGAVSEEIAIAMATGASEKFGADYGLSVTGFAGPAGGTQVLPVGSIFLGYSSPVGVWAKKIQLRGDRASNRRRAATAALDWMRRKLRKYKIEEVFAAADSGHLEL